MIRHLRSHKCIHAPTNPFIPLFSPHLFNIAIALLVNSAVGPKIATTTTGVTLRMKSKPTLFVPSRWPAVFKIISADLIA